MYLVSSGSQHSFKHDKRSPRLQTAYFTLTKSELNFLLRADIFFFPTGHWNPHEYTDWPENYSAACGSAVFSGTNVGLFGWGLLEYSPPQKKT